MLLRSLRRRGIKLTRVHFFFHAHFTRPAGGHSFVFLTVGYRAFHLYYIPGAPKIKSFKACCTVFYVLCAVGTLYRAVLFQVFSKCLKPQYHVSLEKCTQNRVIFYALIFQKLL